jgi:hypothetical protein
MEGIAFGGVILLNKTDHDTPLVEYIHSTTHLFHFPIVLHASSRFPYSTIMFAGALCSKMPPIPIC